MAYALFAMKKQLLTALLNSAQLQMDQRANEQFQLATDHTGLQKQVSSLGAAQASELAGLYGMLSETSDSKDREDINIAIQIKQQEFKRQEDEINNQIYEISIKEQAIELEVKRLETVVSVLKQQRDEVIQAEGDGIQSATPKYNGVG